MKVDTKKDTVVTLVLVMENDVERNFIINQLNFAKDTNTALVDKEKEVLGFIAGKVNEAAQ